MTIEEYYSKLVRHDWFYEYSDDHSVWQRGRASRGELHALAKDNDKFAVMLEDYIRYINAIIANGPKQEEVASPSLEDYL